MEKDDDEKRRKWKWTRTSEETKIVRKMEKNFLALRKNEMFKKNRCKRTINVLTMCKNTMAQYLLVTLICLIDLMGKVFN